MRFLFTIHDAISHVNPMLPVARTLKKCGHEVIFATGESIIPYIEDKGFSTITLPLDLTAEQLIEWENLPVHERGSFDIGRLFADYFPPLVLETLTPIIEKQRPDLIIRDQLEFGGYLTGEVFNIPHVVLNISAGWQVATKWLMSQVEVPLLAHRQKLNLPEVPIQDSLFRYLRLDMAPESLLPLDYFKTPTTYQFNQFNEDRADANSQLPDWFAELPYDETVLITFGTVWNDRDDLLHILISAMQTEGVNIIVATGQATTTLDFEAYPAHVKVVSYVPFTALLPHLSTAIFHGGFVTLLTMLNGGVPVIVTPLAADHFMNGGLVDAAKVGMTIQSDDLSMEVLREALSDILKNPIYRQNALRIQRDMQAMLSVADACDMIENLAREKKSI